ncbi:MAG TPA: SBBP repeat-containing protein [Candidatus Sulfotelmatobacter sp.]|nr:SBBP repeat-containing protein [Candidatus Sulfotelmatobacter sp.]
MGNIRMGLNRRACRLLLFVTFCHFAMAAPAQDRTAAQALTYGRVPLNFEANRGQTNPQTRFLVHGRGYTAHLTTDGMILSLRTKPAAASNPQPQSSGINAVKTVEIRLQGANAKPTAVGEQQQPGIVNYFIGSNPANWRTGIPTYAQVRYKDVYPGIDLVYHGNHQQLEYDFEVRPGANPDQIAFEIRGAQSAELNKAGNLTLDASGGYLQMQCPVVYQRLNGKKVPIQGAYIMRDRTHVGFKISQYDRNQPLVIDPVLVYATYLGGSGVDVAGGTAVDGSGNLYITGYTDSADFASTPDPLPANANHVFVSKLDASGSHLLYTDYIGGNGEDYGAALVLDSSSGVFVTGSTSSSDFPVVNGYQQQALGPYTGFLTHISPDGSSLSYSTYLGGSTMDLPAAIAINQSGQVYVAGYTLSRDYPVINAYQGSVSPNQGGVYGGYGFVTKFSQDGSSLLYSTYLGGSSNVAQPCGTSTCWPAPYNFVSTISVDANDNAYVAGTTNTYNFPATTGSYLSTNNTTGNAYIGFVSKLSGAGALSYSTYFYGSSGNPVSIASIAVDTTGSAYIAGSADSDGTFPITTTSLCDPGVYGFECSYAFVTKFDPAGATLLYSTFLGPQNYASPSSILLDSQTNAYILANTSSPLFSTVNPLQGYDSGLDVLLIEINPDASAQVFSTYLGGSGDEVPSGMAIDNEENVYIAGSTSSADFPVTQGAFQSQFAGSNDAFLAKIFTGSAPLIALSTTALQFPATVVGAQSQPVNVQLQNLSAMPLTISSISVSGDFSQTNDCGNTLGANSSCILAVTFIPSASGNRSGAVVLNDNAAGAPQSISLQGTGTASTVGLSLATLSFSATAVGTSSVAQTVSLTNQGGASLKISSVQVTGDFSQTNNCPASLSSGSQCTFQVVFSPKVAGSRSGSLAVSDSGAGSPQSVTLSGTGSDFVLNGSTSIVAVNSGATATYTIQVNPVGGAFSSTVVLSCSQVPSQATCKAAPDPVTPGANGSSVTVTIATGGSSSSSSMRQFRDTRSTYAAWVQLQGLGLAGLVFMGAGFRRKKLPMTLGLLSIMLLLSLAMGCAGGTGVAQQSGKTTPPGTYTVVVTGTSGALKHSVDLTLVVQ